MSISLPFSSPNASNTEYVSFNDAFEKGSPLIDAKPKNFWPTFIAAYITIPSYPQ